MKYECFICGKPFHDDEDNEREIEDLSHNGEWNINYEAFCPYCNGWTPV